MPYKLSQAPQDHTDSNNHSRSAEHLTQHGLQNDRKSHWISFLLTIPSEALTHITSFLEPPSLLTLARTNKQLYDHINDDNTWHRAFLCQFLGVGPESDIREAKSLLLRRTESSWKKEFVHRFNLKLRWEKSRTPTVTHLPLINSTISSIHLISEHGLLTSSIQYGVVSRSHPLTGKVWKGHLDAAGTLNGLGIANPNAEASPNVSTCCLTSAGSTAKILWGFRHGEVAVTFANRVLDSSRIGGAKLIRCNVADEHDGMVVDVVWSPDGNVFVSAGIDGRVKVWDGKKVRCLWTSERQTGNLVNNPCAKIAFDADYGTIAVAFNTGDIVIWTGLALLYAADRHPENLHICTSARIVIPASPIIERSNDVGPSQESATLTLYHQSNHQISLLTRQMGDCFFRRFNVDLLSPKVVDEFRFGDECNGAILSIKQVIASNAEESSFILTGDQLGCLNFYEWEASIAVSSRESAIPPAKRLEAYDDGSGITCIEWNPTTFVTGSSTGVVKVWDSLTISLLRSFPSPWSRARGREWESVKQIILEREMVVVAVGDKVMSWKAGPIGIGRKVVVNGGKKGKNNVLAKWRRQIEMHRDIADSKHDLEEEKKSRQEVYEREKGHFGSLDALGLSEQEAIEYVLMLSRDEEETRLHASSPPAFSAEEGLFQGEFDDGSEASSRTSLQPWSPKVKLQQPQREPITTGFVSSSHPLERANSLQSVGSALVTDSNSFPAISSSVPSMSHVWPSGVGKGSTVSPTSGKSAWNTPMKSSPSPPGSVVNASKVPVVVPRQLNDVNVGLVQDDPIISGDGGIGTEEDRDIRYAIELSLAEARSRGEDI